MAITTFRLKMTAKSDQSGRNKKSRFTYRPFVVIKAMCEDTTLEEGSFSVKPRRTRPRDSERRKAIRQKLFQECDGFCLYCGVKMFLPCKDKNGLAKTFPDTATIDHIIPQSKGGTNVQANLLVCCADCNSRKGHSSLLVMMRAKLKIAQQNRYLEVEKNLRVRASVWFTSDPT